MFPTTSKADDCLSHFVVDKPGSERFKWKDTKHVHNIKPVQMWREASRPFIFSHLFIDTFCLHDFNLQLYQKFITLGNHEQVSGHLWKTLCAHFFLEILFMIFSKWFVNLEVLKLSFTYLEFLLISKCLFPNVYWKSTFISFRLLTLSKIEFLSSLPQSHLLFLLYSLSWWLVYSCSPSVSMGDWLLIPNSWILKSLL